MIGPRTWYTAAPPPDADTPAPTIADARTTWEVLLRTAPNGLSDAEVWRLLAYEPLRIGLDRVLENTLQQRGPASSPRAIATLRLLCHPVARRRLDNRYLNLVTPLVNADDPQVRLWAARVLASWSDDRALTAFIPLLDAADDGLQEVAVAALRNAFERRPDRTVELGFVSESPRSLLQSLRLAQALAAGQSPHPKFRSVLRASLEATSTGADGNLLKAILGES